MSLIINSPAMHRPLSLIIELAGAHRFSYTKVAAATGNPIWRWPNEAPISQIVEAKGQMINITA